MYPRFCHIGIFRIEFDQDGVALQPISHQSSRAGSPERVEDGAGNGCCAAGTGWRPANRQGCVVATGDAFPSLHETLASYVLAGL
jgi:hypothetical protein